MSTVTSQVDFFSGPSLDEIPSPTKKNSVGTLLKTIQDISIEIGRCNNEIQKWKTRREKTRSTFKNKLNEFYSIIS